MSTTCSRCGAPKSITRVLDPLTGKTVKKVTQPCRRCT